MSFSRPRSGEFWNRKLKVVSWRLNSNATDYKCKVHPQFTLRLRLTAVELLPLLLRLLLLLLLLWLLLLLLLAIKQLFVITFDDVDCMVGSAFPATGFVLLPMVSSLTAWLPESLAHVAFVLLLLIFTKRCLWCFWVLLLLGPPCDDPLNEWERQQHQLGPWQEQDIHSIEHTFFGLCADDDSPQHHLPHSRCYVNCFAVRYRAAVTKYAKVGKENTPKLD